MYILAAIMVSLGYGSGFILGYLLLVVASRSSKYKKRAVLTVISYIFSLIQFLFLLVFGRGAQSDTTSIIFITLLIIHTIWAIYLLRESSVVNGIKSLILKSSRILAMTLLTIAKSISSFMKKLQ